MNEIGGKIPNWVEPLPINQMAEIPQGIQQGTKPLGQQFGGMDLPGSVKTEPTVIPPSEPQQQQQQGPYNSQPYEVSGSFNNYAKQYPGYNFEPVKGNPFNTNQAGGLYG